VDSLVWGATLDPVPLLAVETATWLSKLAWQATTAVGRALSSIGNGVLRSLQTGSIVPLPGYDFEPPAGSEVIAFPDCEIDNIELSRQWSLADWNACMVAACCNSMHWLDGKHPEFDIPLDLQGIFDQLNPIMGRTWDAKTGTWGGVTTEQAIRAKLDFIEAYSLPIHVKYQSDADHGAVKSTSGLTSATCQNPDSAHTHPPTEDWLFGEAKAKEDVEIGLEYYYNESDGSLQGWGHEVTLSGALKENGKPYVVTKDDANQSRPGGRRQVPGPVTPGTVNGTPYMFLPALNGWTTRKNGDLTRTYAVVRDVISESYDASVGPPPSTGTFTYYCQNVARTIRPGYKLTITYPDQDRCLNSSVMIFDRKVGLTPLKPTEWNFNRNATRQVVNQTDHPITVFIHNVNYVTPPYYPPYSVSLAMVPCGPAEQTSPSNEGAYGGTSLGGRDSSGWEFGRITDSLVVVRDTLGMDLGAVPDSICAGRTTHLVVQHPIGAWNEYWTRLGLQLGVAGVSAPGSLIVQCPSTGLETTVSIPEAGNYFVDLGTMSQTSVFEISLRTVGDLRFAIDCIGVPSLVPTGPAGVRPGELPRQTSLGPPRPNPSGGTTEMRFALPRAGHVALAVFDVTGRRVRTLVVGVFEPGEHTAQWDGRDGVGRPTASGLYFVRLEADGRTFTRRLAVVR
jgi:hypothetical protein